MATILDVSNVQGFTINWRAVRQAGVEGVFLKATEGLTFNDGRFQTWRKQANAVGIHVGAYHFARPDLHPSGAEEEAAHFCSIVGKIGRTDLKPVLDFETPGGSADWIHRFNHTVRKQLGRFPAFYSYPARIADLYLKTPVGDGLWLASYSRNDGTEHPFVVPAPWRKAIAHQFSSNCRIAGVAGAVDLSHAPSLKALLAHPVVGSIGHGGGGRALKL